jgi:hypothetical protein
MEFEYNSNSPGGRSPSLSPTIRPSTTDSLSTTSTSSTAPKSSDLVLVTGGRGFIASHLIHQLVLRGYRVRTTVRRNKDFSTMSSKSDESLYLPYAHIFDIRNLLEIVECDLLFDNPDGKHYAIVVQNSYHDRILRLVHIHAA